MLVGRGWASFRTLAGGSFPVRCGWAPEGAFEYTRRQARWRSFGLGAWEQAISTVPPLLVLPLGGNIELCALFSVHHGCYPIPSLLYISAAYPQRSYCMAAPIVSDELTGRDPRDGAHVYAKAYRGSRFGKLLGWRHSRRTKGPGIGERVWARAWARPHLDRLLAWGLAVRGQGRPRAPSLGPSLAPSRRHRPPPSLLRSPHPPLPPWRRLPGTPPRALRDDDVGLRLGVNAPRGRVASGSLARAAAG